MKQDMEASLAVVQLGITLVGAIAAATGGKGAEEMISPVLQDLGMSAVWGDVLAISLVVIPLTALTIVFGELVPKIFALRNKEWVCLRLSPLMRLFTWSVWPVVWILEHSATLVMEWTERLWKPKFHHPKSEAAELQELRAIASLARTARLIGAREESIILGAARLSSRSIREVMLPAEHISMLNLNDSVGDCLIAAHLDMHTRFPVAERAGDPQSIVGYVNFKDMVAHMRFSPHERSLRGILRAILNVADHLPISSALEKMMREHTHIALVRDGTGLVLGMVTLEDILEELVGDIQDEFDLLPTHVVGTGAGWIVGGGINLIRLRELTGIDLAADLPQGGARHLSGWVAGHLGRPARGADIVERNGVRIVVRKVRRQQVQEAQVSRQPTPAAASQQPALAEAPQDAATPSSA
jgi:putative hemolysin